MSDEAPDLERRQIADRAYRAGKADGRREALTEAVKRWRDEGHGVLFNRPGDDLTPEGRVGKWLRDQTEGGEAS